MNYEIIMAHKVQKKIIEVDTSRFFINDSGLTFGADLISSS